MVKLICIMLCIFIPQITLANEQKGNVCLGENLSKVASEHTKRLHLTINNSAKIYFPKPYRSPRLISQNLELNDTHTINVYFDEHIVQSWNLDLRNYQYNSVLIWRAAGAWRMYQIDPSNCGKK